MVNPLGAVFPVVCHQQSAGYCKYCAGQSVVQSPSRDPHPLLIPVPFDHFPNLFLASTLVRKLLEREACLHDYLSAFPRGGMSNSRIHKAFISTIVAVVVIFSAGCGDEENNVAPTPGEATASVPSEAPESEPTGAAEGTDLAPVDLELDDGGFASSTPKEFHVPSDFLVLITAKNVSDASIRLSISAPSLAQTFKIAPGKTETITLASIPEGERAKMISGGKTIEIAADAEPGP